MRLRLPDCVGLPRIPRSLLKRPAWSWSFSLHRDGSIHPYWMSHFKDALRVPVISKLLLSPSNCACSGSVK